MAILDINKKSLPEQVQENKENIEILMNRHPDATELVKRIALASDFDETQTYAVGDLVWIKTAETYYLYECNTAIIAPEPLDPNKWTQVNVKDLLDEKQDKLTTALISTGTINYYIGFNSTGNVIRMNNIKLTKIQDGNNHDRFIEGDGTVATISGFTASYCKWSLSGSHIMFVCAGTFENGSTIAAGQLLCYFTLPQWILDKIYPVFSNIIELKEITFYDNSFGTQTKQFGFDKSAPYMRIKTPSTVPLTFTSEKHFRVQFDLLIDSE